MSLTKIQLLALALSLSISLAADATNPEAAGLTHVRFGTPQSSSGGSGGIDGGTLLAQSRDGTLIVAGFADSFPSDTGGVPAKPMLSKFDRNGNLIWQRVYDRLGWSIVGIDASSEQLSVILWYPEPGRWNRLDSEHESYSEHGLVQLWTTRTDGELDRKLMTLHHRVTQARTPLQRMVLRLC